MQIINKTETVTTSGIDINVQVVSKDNDLTVRFLQGDSLIQFYGIKTLLVNWMNDTQLSKSGLCLVGSSNDYDIGSIDMNILRAFFINTLINNYKD